MDTKEVIWAEIKAAVEAGQDLEDVVFDMLVRARRQRDNALARVRELAEEIESHREYWRGGRRELEQAKTDAAQANNRAQRLQKRIRQQAEGRRREDRQNAALRSVFEVHLRDIRRLEKEGTWPYGQEGHADMVEDLQAALKD